MLFSNKQSWAKYLLISLMTVCWFSIQAMAADEDLDTSFSSDGKLITVISNHSTAKDIAIQPDGKIVVAGQCYNGTNNDFAVARYNADGSLDTTFSGDGKVTAAIGSGNDRGTAVAIQTDGKIVVAGYSDNGTDDEFAVVRFNADGSLDTSFDGDGWVTTDLSSNDDGATAIVIQSDGKIVVAGYADNGYGYDFAVVRYNIDGSLDTSFSIDGKVPAVFGSGTHVGHAVAIQSDGKIIIAGNGNNTSGYDFAVVRYNTDGTRDTTFAGDGAVITDFGSSFDGGQAVAIQPDGKIVVAGYSDVNSSFLVYDFALVRYKTDGSLDLSFGDNGKVTTNVGSGTDSGQAITIQPNGKIVVAGYAGNGSNDDFALVRYKTDGSLDTSFAGDGKLVTDFGGSDDQSYAVTVQSDGKILLAGGSVGGSWGFAVARYGMADTPADLIDWNGNLVADFGVNGLWYHDGSNWNWMSNKGYVGRMTTWNGKLIVDFGAGKGLWYYDTAWHWMTNKADPNMMITWNNGTTEVLVVDFGSGQRVFTYDGSWNWLTNKDNVNAMTVWNNKLIVDFGLGRGVYNYDTSWHWMSNKGDVTLMLPWDDGSTEALVMDFGGGRRVYTYGGAWSWLTNKDDVNNMTVWNQKLVIDFGGGRSVYAYDGTWSWMSNKDNTICMVPWNGGSDLAADFGSGRNMYNYNGAWTWIRNADDVPAMVAWGNRLAVDFGPGLGVYSYNGSWNQVKAWSTAE